MRWPLVQAGPERLDERVGRWMLIAGASLLATFALGWLITANAGGPVWSDLSAKSFALPQSEPARSIALWLADVTGSTEAAIEAIVIGVLLAGLCGWWRSALVVVGATLLVAPVTNLVKDLFERPRPDWHTVDVHFFSYPSGHTSGTAALVISLIVVIRRTWIWVIGIAWLVATIWGRIYLGAHWISDTIGGVLLALAVVSVVAALVSALFRLLSRRNTPEIAA